MIETKPKCPNCGGTIKPTSSYEECDSDEQFYVVEWEGTCLNCGHEIGWTKNFTFVGIGEVYDYSKDL